MTSGGGCRVMVWMAWKIYWSLDAFLLEFGDEKLDYFKRGRAIELHMIPCQGYRNDLFCVVSLFVPALEERSLSNACKCRNDVSQTEVRAEIVD